MKAVQRAVAMTLVATALCADRAVASPQMIAPQESTHRTLVGRLNVTIRRCVPAVRLMEIRCEQERPLVGPLAAALLDIVARPSLSPFEFRLPPPLR